MKRWTRLAAGFTLVELVIIVAVIGILASITIVAYNGIQRRSASVAMVSDLNNASSSLERVYMKERSYPAHLPLDIKPSPNVQLTVGSSRYTNLSSSQNALLLYDTCKQMIAQGKGKTTSSGGTTVDIVTDCLVYTNDGYFHINGWSVYLGPDTIKLQVPVASSDIASRAAAITYYDPYYPNGTTTAKNFLTELDQRFRDQGGTYPISILWDEGNSPVAKPILPPLPPGGGSLSSSTYCVQARHLRYSDLAWHIRPEGKPVAGTCV